MPTETLGSTNDTDSKDEAQSAIAPDREGCTPRRAGGPGESITYLSFGGGPPSVALLILNALGRISQKAELVVFADPGAEDPRTYDVLPAYEDFAVSHGIPFVRVSSNAGPLATWIAERSVPIPVFTPRGMGRRQCTERWKIRPIHKLLRQDLGYTKVVAQLAMTWEEVWRMRNSPAKYVTNTYPLIDHRFRRDACIELIQAVGLPVPPRSACVFCPLKGSERWRETLVETPEAFDSAARLENAVNSRLAAASKGPVYFTRERMPLDILGPRWLGDADLTPPEADDGQCETGHCFT